jgi:hypothetical protein
MVDFHFLAAGVTEFLNFLLPGRDIRHNISFSGFFHNRAGAVYYSSAGEINPILTMEWNQIVDNGAQLYGNFSTSEAAVALDVQNMDSLLFRVSFFFYYSDKLIRINHSVCLFVLFRTI